MERRIGGWSPLDELEYQISFDMPLFVEGSSPEPEKPKSPTPTKPIRPIRQPEVEKKHIRRNGKK
jgi:hypothetical protein